MVHRLKFKWSAYSVHSVSLSPLTLFSPQVVVSKNVNGHQKQIRRMGKGEHFGEQALIR